MPNLHKALTCRERMAFVRSKETKPEMTMWHLFFCGQEVICKGVRYAGNHAHTIAGNRVGL
jgi:hypothetical protein